MQSLRTVDLTKHPCFGLAPCGSTGRIHLPVAPKCNTQCAFCDRRYDCANESRPGVTSAVITPEEAVERASRVLMSDRRIRVVGIAGPGDPFANEETFMTADLLRRRLPEAMLCISTNGIALDAHLAELREVRPDTITVTINTCSLRTAEMLYSHVVTGSDTLYGADCAAFILEKQRHALSALKQLPVIFKVNTVLIPGVNDTEIAGIAALSRQYGASVMNIMPLIPCGSMKNRPAPSAEMLAAARTAAGKAVRQFTACRQCRADACGIL